MYHIIYKNILFKQASEWKVIQLYKQSKKKKRITCQSRIQKNPGL